MKNPPNSICILRLSAIGDITHIIPIVRTLQKHWPNTKLTWIIGKKEVGLVDDFSGVNFIVFDKTNFLKSYLATAKKMRGKLFDVLICAQVSMRANIISILIPAKLKLGYDKARAKSMHSSFVHESIPASSEQHVLDSFFSFIERLGLKERELSWDYIVPEDAHTFAEKYIDQHRTNVIISPCSSHSKRNWRTDRYAAVADYAVQSLNAHVILCGGPTEFERKVGKKIEQSMQTDVTNLIGKDDLKKFLALLKRADVIITPDAGPAHIAAGCNTPVLGLYAASNPRRSGPYLSLKNCIDKYDEAARKFRNRPASELKWGTKLEYEGVMDLIQVEDVINKLEQILTQHT